MNAPLQIPPIFTATPGRLGIRYAYIYRLPLRHDLARDATGLTDAAGRKVLAEYDAYLDRVLPPNDDGAATTRKTKKVRPLPPGARRACDVSCPTLNLVSISHPFALAKVNQLRRVMARALARASTQEQREKAIKRLWTALIRTCAAAAPHLEDLAPLRMFRLLHNAMARAMTEDPADLENLVTHRESIWDEVYAGCHEIYRAAFTHTEQADCTQIVRLIHSNRSFHYTLAYYRLTDPTQRRRAATLALGASLEARALGLDSLTVVNSFEAFWIAQDAKLLRQNGDLIDAAWSIDQSAQLLAKAAADPVLLAESLRDLARSKRLPTLVSAVKKRLGIKT